MNDIVAKGVELLSKVSGKKVLVAGDLMIDEYIWGAVERVSPEAPVPVVGVKGQTLRLGGAANVANNIVSLGGRVELCGVVGDDQMGRWLVSDLEKKGIGVRGIVTVQGRPTTVKTRVMAHDQQVVRVDKEVTTPIEKSDERILLASAGSFLSECGCLILSDYAKGVLTTTMIRDLIQQGRKAGLPVAVDPKVIHFPMYKNVTVLTPNLLETSAGSGVRVDGMENLLKAGRKIFEKLRCENLIITRGEQGMTVFEGVEKVTHLPADSRQVYDVTGAGDTVISTVALGLASGLSVLESAYLANVAAGIVVGEVGTVAVSPEMIRNRLVFLAAGHF